MHGCFLTASCLRAAGDTALKSALLAPHRTKANEENAKCTWWGAGDDTPYCLKLNKHKILLLSKSGTDWVGNGRDSSAQPYFSHLSLCSQGIKTAHLTCYHVYKWKYMSAPATTNNLDWFLSYLCNTTPFLSVPTLTTFPEAGVLVWRFIVITLL